jgi:hypothetical protein
MLYKTGKKFKGKHFIAKLYDISKHSKEFMIFNDFEVTCLYILTKNSLSQKEFA